MTDGPISGRTPLLRLVDTLTTGAHAPALLVQLEPDWAAVAMKPSGLLLVVLDAHAPSTWEELSARATKVMGTEKPDVLAGLLPNVAVVVLLGADKTLGDLLVAPATLEALARPVHWIVVRPDGALVVDPRPVPNVRADFLRPIDSAIEGARLRVARAADPAARVALERAGEDTLAAETRFREAMLKRKSAPWTIGLIVACCAVTGVEFMRGTSTSAQLVSMGALVGTRAFHGYPETLLSYGFLHGGMVHIGMNMLALWSVGRPLEMIVGGRRVLVVFALAVLGGGLMVSVVRPEELVVGASAGIFGLITALFGIAVRGGGALPDLARARIKRGILATLGINLVISLMPGVSLLGHLGGSIAGFVLGVSGALSEGLDLPWRAPPDPARAKAMTSLYAFATIVCVVALAGSVIVAWARG